jgi:serine/threonine protein kinase
LKKIDIKNIDETDTIPLTSQITKITNEAKVLAKLNHQSIIKYFDSYRHGNSYCIVTEICAVCISL